MISSEWSQILKPEFCSKLNILIAPLTDIFAVARAQNTLNMKIKFKIMFERGFLVAFTVLAITLPHVAAVEVRRLQDSLRDSSYAPTSVFSNLLLRALRPAVRSD